MRTGRAFPAHVILLHGALETKVVSPPVAAATGSVPTPILSITLLVPVAAATGIALAPTLELDVLDLPPAATATASVPTPQAGLDITIAPPSASVSAAFVPSVGIGNNTILAPPATAWAGQAVFDTFQRTLSTGDFGVSPTGHHWNNTQGADVANHTVDGSEAVFAFPTPDSDREQLLGFTWTDVDMRCRFRFSAAPTASQVVFSLVLRYTDATNLYRVNFQYKATGAPTLTFTRGVSTSIGSTINAATISPNTWYWMRGRMDGTGFIYSKTWADGTDEPKDWQNSFDDSNNGSASGSIGLRAQTQSGNGSLNLLMDDVYAGGTGTGASTPAISITLLPPAASASAASVPQVTTTQIVPITPATATGSAPAPGGESDVLMLAPAPTATASVPTVIATVVAFTPASTATASAPQPALSITLFPPAPTATASSTAVVKLTLLPNAATATISSAAPTLTITVLPPAATSTASVTGVLAAVLVLPGPASASASSNTPVLVISSTVIVTPAAAIAMTAAKLITGTRYHGWKARPITPTIIPIGNSQSLISLTLVFDFHNFPIVRGTYLNLDAIHRHRTQTFEYVSGWTPRSYIKQLPDGTRQTLQYNVSDSITLQVVGSGQRFFALGISDQTPIPARKPITPGLMHRIDILADCSKSIWTGRWKFDSIEQQPITTERRAEYYLPDVQSSMWRQVTLAPDADSQYSDFEILGFQSDLAGAFPLP